jgi:ribosomal protein S17E
MFKIGGFITKLQKADKQKKKDDAEENKEKG